MDFVPCSGEECSQAVPRIRVRNSTISLALFGPTFLLPAQKPPPPPRATSRLSGVKPNKSHGQPQAVTLAPSYPRQIYTPGHILKEAPDNDGPPNLRFDGTVIWLRKCLVRPRSNLSPPTFDEKAGLGAPSVRFALSRHSSSASRPRSS
jgi:hypothetical protein